MLLAGDLSETEKTTLAQEPFSLLPADDPSHTWYGESSDAVVGRVRYLVRVSGAKSEDEARAMVIDFLGRDPFTYRGATGG